MSRSAALLRLLGGVACIAVCAFLYVHKPPSPDQSIFDYIGWVGSQGGRYYVDVAEQNFPGEMLLHEVAIRMFGARLWAYRAIDFCVLCMGAGALWYLLRSRVSGVGAAAGALAYVVGYVSSNPWMSGQRDAVATNLLLVAGAALRWRIRGGGGWLIGCVGAVFFVAMLLRPTFGLFALPLVWIDRVTAGDSGRSLRRTVVDTGGVAGVALVLAALCAGWGVAGGSLDDFADQAILFNVQSYAEGHSATDTLGRLHTVGVHYLWFLPAAVVGLAGTWGARGAPPGVSIVAALFPLGVVSAIVQNKGFAYHLAPILPPVFAFCGVASWSFVGRLIERSAERRPHVVLRGVFVILATAGLMAQVRTLGPQIRFLVGYDSYRQMLAREPADGLSWEEMTDAAEYVRDGASSDDTILVWGRAVSLHLMAERRSPSRFITHGMLLLAAEPFPRSEAWSTEFVDAMVTRPPRYIFLQEVGGLLDFGDRISSNPNRRVVEHLRHVVTTEYDLQKKFGQWRAFRRRDVGAPHDASPAVVGD